MDWYEVVKFLHVVAAVAWVGGAFLTVVLGAKAIRAGNDTEVIAVVRQVAWAAERIFVPASIATLVLGLIVAWIGNLWGNLWVILGLIGVAITIGMGIGILTPMIKKVEAGLAAGGTAATAATGARNILTIARFDIVLLFTIVADMVLKPSYADWIVLVIMAIVLIAAAVAFLAPVMRKSAVPA